jgi:hypothetical protein
MDSFQIPQVGSEPVSAPVGFAGGDYYPFRSIRFWSPLVNAYLTEKNEGIVVLRNEDGSWYRAYAPLPWCVGKVDTLINFNDLGQKGPHDPMTADISGTMANHDILITLRGKNESYSFTWDFDQRNMKGWIKAKPISVTSQPTSVPNNPMSSAAVGDRMKMSLLSQQKIGDSSHLLTVFAEAPLPDKRGRSKAFYYFVQNAVDGTGLKFLTSQASDDHQPLGSGPGDDPAANPAGKLFGSMLAGNAKVTLTIGKDVSCFAYNYKLQKWSKNSR